MGKFHNERRWYYNNGVEFKFYHSNYAPMDIGKLVTIIRHITDWNVGYHDMQRSWAGEGLKAIQLHRSNIDKNSKNPAYKRKEYASSPGRFFKKKNDNCKYPAVSSYQKLKIIKDTIDIYMVIN